MATSRSQNNSKLFIAIEERPRDRLINKNFEYPLSFYERKISIQANALNYGLQLHLFILATTTYGYRLSAEAADNNQTKFMSLASIALSSVETTKTNNPRHLNTIILKIED
ncbi:unnamed protein product [Rotaria sp. Silwood2]|nr:unnamed protein product [Rotaria sp. Silwood2]CAF4462637.1 unnamed protein product [Rotaria sp. Silwood2]